MFHGICTNKPLGRMLSSDGEESKDKANVFAFRGRASPSEWVHPGGQASPGF